MAVTFRSASGGQSSTAALTASVTQPSGAASGDLVLVALNIKNSTSDTFSAVAGWTLSSQNANAFTVPFKTAVYWRVLDGTESWPVSFSWTATAAKFAWNALAFTPGGGNIMAIDGEAAVKVDTSGASTHTANSQTAVAASVCSVIINCGRTSTTGATAISVTPAASWTEPTNGDQSTASGTTSALAQLGVESCYRTGQSGTVTPGASTWSQSTIGANVYHFLLTDPAPETSPPLELSGFAISGPASGDTINSVTVAVTEHQSNAAQAACTVELWDYSGTPAQIGTTQTGTASTSTSNVSSATFTGVTYSQLATLRVRVYGHAGTGTGYTESVDGVSLVVNYTPAPGGGSADASLTVTAALSAAATTTSATAAVPAAVLAATELFELRALPARSRVITGPAPGGAAASADASLAVTATLAATAQRAATAGAAAPLTAGLTAAAQRAAAADAALAGTAGLAATAQRAAAADASLPVTAGLAGAAQTGGQAAAAMAVTAALSASAAVTTAGINADAALAETAVLTAAAQLAATADASLPATAVLAATAQRAATAGAVLPVTAGLAATAQLAATAGSALPVTAALSAIAAVTAPGINADASFAVTAGLTATARLGATADATLAVTAALAAGQQLAATLAGQLAVTGGLAAGGSLGAKADAALALTAALTATGDVPLPFTAGTLTAADRPLATLTASDTRTGGPS